MNEKHKLMKPKDPARIGRQASQRAKKWQSRLSAALLCALLFTVFFPSCKDEDLLPSAGMKADITRADGTLNDGGAGLVQDGDGNWVATRRVPLVGAGRVVNNVSNALVEVGSIDDNEIEEYATAAQNVVDLDLLGTTFKPTAIVGANIAFNQIISILDLNRTYAGGQKAGFALKSGSEGVLSVGLFSGLVLRAFRDGVKVDSVQITNQTSLLNLSLGNVTAGNASSIYVIEKTFSEAFDELQLGTGGVNINLGNNDLEILYAYVGENPKIPAVNNGDELSQAYFGVENITLPTGLIPDGDGQRWSTYDEDASAYKLINNDISDGVYLIRTANACCMTVDFNRTIPAGSEVGFIGSGFSVLGPLVGGTEVMTYNNEVEMNNYSYTKILKLELFYGAKEQMFGLVTDKECTRVRFYTWGIGGLPGLDNTLIHYAYVREPVEIDASSYFSFTDATVYTPNYRFADPILEGARVEYSVMSCPLGGEAATIDYIRGEDGQPIDRKKNLLTKMNAEGPYEIQAKFFPPDSNEPIIYTATITRKAKAEDYCNTPLINDDGNHWKAEVINEGWGVNIFGEQYEGSLNNVVNSETDDYIETKSGLLSLIANSGIISVKSIDGTKIKNPKRAGFIVNRSTDFLSADVLKFLRIELWNGNQRVDGGLTDDNNGVSLGLIGNAGSGNGNGLARLSIETDVPEFDCIKLYTSGLLDLNLASSIKIYYAFYDEASENCATPGEECMELITNANYGAMATTNNVGLLNVGTTVTDLGSIVDNDIDTKASFVNPVNLGTATEVEVTFDEIQGNQEVGFILSSTTHLADVGLIGITKIEAYTSDGRLIQPDENETTITGNGLGLKLFGAGDRYYISTTPKEAFCKLKLIFGDGATVLRDINIHGLFLRPDYDGDGAIDCINDGLMTDITGLDISKEHYCKGEELPVFTVTGGLEGKRYTLTFENLEINAEPKKTVVKQQSHKFEFDADFFTSLPAGYYRITVNQGSPWTDYIAVHANQTTWLGYNDNWNDWSNWSNGVPWGCTDVILPAPKIKGSDNGASIIGIPPTLNGIQKYPDLRTVQSGKSYQADYHCNNIYFAPGAELVGQHKLDYGGQVFIDMNLESGYYHLLSMPLKATITGDMFVAANWSKWEQNRATAFGNYFSAINSSDTYTEQRRTPYVYQRLWSSNSKVMNETLSRSGGDYDNTDDPTIESGMLQLTDWSRTFNSVETTYDLAEGFALRVDKDAWQSENDASRQTYHFHFPKSFDTYNYYSTSSDIPVKTVSGMKRVGTPGHFMVDMVNNSNLKFTLKRESSGNLFLFGNPMMSHIDIRQFLAENNTNVSSVLVYDKNKKEYVTISNGALTSSTSSITQIAPMEAVFLQAVTPCDSLSITLSDIMLEQGNSTATTVTAPNQLRLTATSRGHSASCVVVPSSAASDDYDAREDATLLVGSEEGSGVAVYTVAGGKALSIQRMNQSGRIPVGFYLKEEGNVTLSFDPQGDAWRGWNLVDQQTGKRYPLDSETNLGTVKSGAGRFYLERTGN